MRGGLGVGLGLLGFGLCVWGAVQWLDGGSGSPPGRQPMGVAAVGAAAPDSPCLASLAAPDHPEGLPDRAGWRLLDATDCQGATWLARVAEPAQSLEDFRRTQLVGSVGGEDPALELLWTPSREGSPNLAPAERVLVAAFLSAALQQKVRVGASVELPADAFRPSRLESRGQFDADKVLQGLASGRSSDSLPALVLTGSDLYVEGLQHIFGIAEPSAQLALVSSHRLLPEGTMRGPLTKPGRESTHSLRRVLKLAFHESAHLLGLVHCRSYRHCLLGGTGSLAEIDAARLQLCPLDRFKLSGRFGWQDVVRWRELAAFGERAGLYPEAQVWRRLAAQAAGEGP